MFASLADANRKIGFAPLVTRQTRLLVLGSLPGEASLAAGQYYANPRNQFWALIGAVIGRDDLPTLAYPDRLDLLAQRGIGLWDVFISATRQGSLDSAIKQAAVSPLACLTQHLPALQAIAFNGKLAAKAGRKAIGPASLTLIDLPSSSPAHATVRLETKLEQWSALKQFLI